MKYDFKKQPKSADAVKRAKLVKTTLVKSVPRPKKYGPTNVGSSRG